jgi:hypothetical protein
MAEFLLHLIILILWLVLAGLHYGAAHYCSAIFCCILALGNFIVIIYLHSSALRKKETNK